MESVTKSALDVLGCANCPANRPPAEVIGNALKCPACTSTWPIGPHGAVNTLIDPAASVVREIEGMRAEKPEAFPTLNSFLFQQVDQVSRFEDRIKGSEGGAKNYYQSTKLNFDYAFNRLPVTGTERVLEIGAEHDFPFLRSFHERGCECFATNLFFCYEIGRPPEAQVVLGDMNRLPYRNGMFDIVLMSATSHHSPDLPSLLREVARITKPSGWVLLLNDPTRGLFKHALDSFGLGAPKGGDRHHLVNENEYSIAEYGRLSKAAGLNVQESFFSVYYDQKLQSGNVSGVRFAPLAKWISRLWKIGPLRRFLVRTALYPGQMLIGLELNLILRKSTD